MTLWTYNVIALLCFFYFCWLFSTEEWENRLIPLLVGFVCALLWPITLLLSIGYAIIKRKEKKDV